MSMGITIHNETGADDPVVCRNGVYVMNMCVNKNLTGDQGVGRHGAP